MVVLRMQALALLLPPLAHATFSSPLEPSIRAATAPSSAAFLPSSPAHRHRRRLATTNAAHAPDRFHSHSNDDAFSAPSLCYVPPYGTVSRSSSIVVLNMSPAGAGVGGGDYGDDRFRKKMNDRRSKSPVVQDFGSADEWNAIKNGRGRMGDDKAGDDGVSEMFGPGGAGGFDLERPPPPRAMERRPPPPVVYEPDEAMTFEGEGGNYWVNPTGSMDRYPSENRRRSGGTMARRSRGGRSSSGRRRRNRGRGADDGEDWWETRRREDEFDDDFDDMDEDFGYEYGGVPPPTRSRSSFRSGAPPPPLPVKQFYDRLFWFGFDPDVTRPTDRTMFGGTRGKFNAMDMLNDREERQRRRDGMRGGSSRRGGGVGSGLSVRRREDSVIQDFGSVGDWNERKTGRGRAGGAAVGDDRERPDYGYESSSDDGMGGPGDPFPGDVRPPPGRPEYDFEAGNGEDLYRDEAMDFEEELTRRRERGGRRRRRDNRRRNIDRRAEEYDRFLSGGGGGVGVRDEYVMEEEYLPRNMGGRSPPSSRRRRGFAYKYDRDALLDYDDEEFIDVEYATEQQLDMAREEREEREEARPFAASGSRRRRSWEERAVEMDRVPPRGAAAWGPNGKVGEDPLDRAATEALGDIRRSKQRLERKERRVEDAKDEVVNLKADASFCENQLEGARGREQDKLEQELGYILQDIEDASRNLRVARAEMDDAGSRVRELEERHWALLSEYEAGRSFEEERAE